MADLIQSISGVLVALTQDPYDFTKGGERSQGVARRAWLVTDPTSAPVQVRFRQDQLLEFTELEKAGPFAEVQCSVKLRAQNDNLQLTLDSLGTVTKASK